MIFIQILSALALDQVFGEARRWHPLVGFGRLATACEKRLNPCSPENTYFEGTGVAVRLRGVLACLFVAVVVGVVFITLGQRRIPTQSAKHVRGRRVYGGTRQYLPLKINQSGIMPIIWKR